jgi:hypothetical protein
MRWSSDARTYQRAHRPPSCAAVLCPSTSLGSLFHCWRMGNMHLSLAGGNAYRAPSGAYVLSHCVSSADICRRCRPRTAAAGGRPQGRP